MKFQFLLIICWLVQQGVNRNLRMVNAITDKQLANSMEIDRKMKYQSLRFPKSSSQRRIVSCGLRNYFALRQTNVSHRFEKRFHCKKQIFSSEQMPCISPWGWLIFSRPLESTYSQWRPFSKLFSYLRKSWTKWSW